MKQLIQFFQKPFRWAAVYGTSLGLFFAFVLLDAFVIPRAQAAASPPEQQSVVESAIASSTAPNPAGTAPEPAEEPSSSPEPAAPTVTTNSYKDESIEITVETFRASDTTLYVADIRLRDPSLLKTALAGGTFGRNIKDTTSNMAEENNAIFAINGDYYGFRDKGWVVRNGALLRDSSGGGDALIVDAEGNFTVAAEDDLRAEDLADAWQVFSFGPALVSDGAVAVEESEEIMGKSSVSNPRTAIGQVSEGHYIAIVSDGRTNGNKGLSLYELAEEFLARGCTAAYNLDGGGSSTMVLNGEVVNNPVGGKRSGGSERKVSDIVYIGYQ